MSRALPTSAIKNTWFQQLFRATQSMEAHMNFSFGSVQLSELRSVHTVLLEQSTAVWHSTHLCKQITAYTVVRSFLLLLSFLPLFFFLFQHKRYFKKYSDRNRYELHINIWLGIKTYIILKSDLSSQLTEVLKSSESSNVINPTEGIKLNPLSQILWSQRLRFWL